eukprot:gnl/TRDRNA2_/TRDRNA2_165863_c0_seq3.p1 gnl/TRDRNA2_/TRDRNA2_165863_c0~~gnl/TRDRNA2_/TRDRNA2_165863_c0_seq3.p1  ORF type:complete len:605 (+),score=75.97 gnl/TRDRNA2_/TRDRNA2_165863_c0_seq3:62-1876(+)
MEAISNTARLLEESKMQIELLRKQSKPPKTGAPARSTAMTAGTGAGSAEADLAPLAVVTASTHVAEAAPRGRAAPKHHHADVPPSPQLRGSSRGSTAVGDRATPRGSPAATPRSSSPIQKRRKSPRNSETSQHSVPNAAAARPQRISRGGAPSPTGYMGHTRSSGSKVQPLSYEAKVRSASRAATAKSGASNSAPSRGCSTVTCGGSVIVTGSECGRGSSIGASGESSSLCDKSSTAGGGGGSVSNISSGSGAGYAEIGMGRSSPLAATSWDERVSAQQNGRLHQNLADEPEEDMDRIEISELFDVLMQKTDDRGEVLAGANGVSLAPDEIIQKIHRMLRDQRHHQRRLEEVQAKLSMLEQQNVALSMENINLRKGGAATILTGGAGSVLKSGHSCDLPNSSMAVASVTSSRPVRTISSTARSPTPGRAASPSAEVSMASTSSGLSATVQHFNRPRPGDARSPVTHLVTRARSESPGGRAAWARVAPGGTPASSTSTAASKVSKPLRPSLSPRHPDCRVVPMRQVTREVTPTADGMSPHWAANTHGTSVVTPSVRTSTPSTAASSGMIRQVSSAYSSSSVSTPGNGYQPPVRVSRAGASRASVR